MEKLQPTPQKYVSIARNYWKELYAQKYENVGEVEKFLENCSLPKLNQDKAESLNRLITPGQIEAVI